MALNFGFTISQARSINLDTSDWNLVNKTLTRFPELQSCIACGGCTATCTAGNLTEFNFRRVHTLVRRGEYKGLYEEISKCMLCGKCRLVCPRGINTRAVALFLKSELEGKK